MTGNGELPGLPQGYYLITDNGGAPILVGTDITVNGTQYTTLNGVPLGLAYAKPTSQVPTKTVSGDTNGTVTVGQDSWELVNSTMNNGVTTVTVKNVKSVSQLPMTGAAGITMLVVIALILAIIGTIIALRVRAVKKQIRRA